MKNKRQISKETTYKSILELTERLIEENGVLNVTTKNIADEANIAHGTLFAHFKNRDELLVKVINGKILGIAKILDDLDRNDTMPLAEFLDDYLNLVSMEEKFFVVISREFPFFSDTIQKEIISMESIIRKSVYSKIESGIISGEYRPVDITMSISFLFATISYYLSRKSFFSEGNKSVIREKKALIINTFLSLLK